MIEGYNDVADKIIEESKEEESSVYNVESPDQEKEKKMREGGKFWM